jgi:hypothetical protein
MVCSAGAKAWKLVWGSVISRLDFAGLSVWLAIGVLQARNP